MTDTAADLDALEALRRHRVDWRRRYAHLFDGGRATDSMAAIDDGPDIDDRTPDLRAVLEPHEHDPDSRRCAPETHR